MIARLRPLLLVFALLVPAGSVAAQPACDISGTWSDDFGTLYLRMSSGGSVSGNYTWQNGKISGIMDGAWINGTWSEEPTFAAPRDAGTFSWQVGEDCSVFTGTYAYAENPEGVAGSWSATRTSTPEPLEPVPASPACDPTGEWSSTHGRLYLYTEGAWRDLKGNWEKGDEIATMQGALEGLRYTGTWQAPSDPTPRHFVMVFDDDCAAFRGDWSDDEVIHNDWVGRRTELAPIQATPVVPTTPLPGACDPRGRWIATHGSIDIDRDGRSDDLRASWLNGDEWRTMRGALVGLTYEGTWSTEADPTPRPFVMVFAADCESFDGQWSEAAQTNHWIGYRPPGATTPTESAETTAPTGGEHIPGLGEDPDDPLGVPGPGMAGLLAAAACAALLAHRRRR